MPFDQDHNASPFNDLPPVAVVAALAMVVIELGLELAQGGYIGGQAGVGWRLAALERFAFSGPRLEWMLADTSRWSVQDWGRLLTYPFIHGSFMHMAFGVVILLALGNVVGKVLSGLALAATWIGASVVGALGYALLTSTQVPLYGAMPGDYGLVGAFTFLLWRRARVTGENQIAAFRMILMLIGLQLFFSMLQGGLGPYIVAEICGFAGGFALAFLFGPGGWRTVLAAIRRR